MSADRREPGRGVECYALIDDPAAPKRSGSGIGGFSSDASATLLSPEALAAAAQILAAAMKDKGYRATPIGLLVGRYIRWCRNERGLVNATTIRDYEYTLAKMSLTLANLEPQDVTLEDLRTVIDLWAANEPNTRKKVTSAIRSFWKWAEEEGHVDRSPAASLRTPKIPKRAPDLLPQAVDTQLLAAAHGVRDKLAVMILLELGVRKSELGSVRVGDFDLARRTITIFGKGRKETCGAVTRARRADGRGIPPHSVA